MAQLEVVENRYYQADCTLAVGAYTAATANFNGSSKILSIVRKTAGGTVGIPVARAVAPTAAGASAAWQLAVFSSSATDVSVYTVFWVNGYMPSNYYAQSGAGTLVQFAP